MLTRLKMHQEVTWNTAWAQLDAQLWNKVDNQIFGWLHRQSNDQARVYTQVWDQVQSPVTMRLKWPIQMPILGAIKGLF